MKTIGLIGGMSWESTDEYYRIINESTNAKLGGLHSAKCLVYSVDFQEIEVLQRQNEWRKLSYIMVDAAERLKRGGADFILIGANTMHKVYSDIENKAGIKVLHIAEATGEKITQRGIKRIGLLGTKYTMEEDFYKKILIDKFGLEVIIPNDEERSIVHEVIYKELCQGVINDASKERYKDIINKLALKGAEGVILGCTEIPLLIKEEDVSIPIFDTTAIHAVSAVEFALNDQTVF